jgi:hypothetical protein
MTIHSLIRTTYTSYLKRLISYCEATANISNHLRMEQYNPRASTAMIAGLYLLLQPPQSELYIPDAGFSGKERYSAASQNFEHFPLATLFAPRIVHKIVQIIMSEFHFERIFFFIFLAVF